LTNLCESLEVTQVNGNKLGKDMLSKMKTNVVVAALLLAVSAHAKDTGIAAPAKINVAAIQASFSELPAVEIPVRASELMKAASKEAKVETAKAILKSVLEQRPQMAIQLVASLVKAAPETASQIVTLGVAIVPQYATDIIRVAAATAPTFAKDIALASSMAFPSQQESIVRLVSSVVPSARGEISSSVARQFEMQRMISDALAQTQVSGNVQTKKVTIAQLTNQSDSIKSYLEAGIKSSYPAGFNVVVTVGPAGITIKVDDASGNNVEDIDISANQLFPDSDSVTLITGGQSGQDPLRYNN